MRVAIKIVDEVVVAHSYGAAHYDLIQDVAKEFGLTTSQLDDLADADRLEFGWVEDGVFRTALREYFGKKSRVY